MFLDVDDVGQRRVGEDRDGLVEAEARIGDGRVDLCGGLTDQGGEPSHHVGVLLRGQTRKSDLLGDRVTDERVAVAIEDQTPGRGDRDRPDLIGGHRLGRGRRLEDLEGPQAQAEQREEHDDCQARDPQTEPWPCRGGVGRVEHRLDGEATLSHLRLPRRPGLRAALGRGTGEALRAAEGVAE